MPSKLGQIREALRVACDLDPGLDEMPDVAAGVRVLVQRNAQLRRLLADYEKLTATRP